MESYISTLNYISGFLYVVSGVPQIIKAMRTKSTKDISMITQVIYLVADIFYEIFGSYHDIKSIWIPGIFNLAFECIIICLKIYYDYYHFVDTPLVSSDSEVIDIV